MEKKYIDTEFICPECNVPCVPCDYPISVRISCYDSDDDGESFYETDDYELKVIMRSGRILTDYADDFETACAMISSFINGD